MESGNDNSNKFDEPQDTISTSSQDTISPSGSDKTIYLTGMKAFPSAFGAGKELTGGRGGKIYEVTNLNDSGPGSLREALTATGPRIVIIKVEGLVNLQSPLLTTRAAQGDLTIWGQFAPGRGLTFRGHRLVMDNSTNIIMRHFTGQNEGDVGFSTIRVEDLPPGGGVYLDHISARYGRDQTLDVISRHSDNKITVAYCLLAEGDREHRTGGILGDSGSGATDTGQSTFARNMVYNLSHRFPNVSGSVHKHENYNNYGVNLLSRIVRTNGGVLIDYFSNYMEKGNKAQTSSIPVNKMGLPKSGFRTYTGWNFVDGVADEPADNQKNLWVNYKDNDAGKDNQPIESNHYVNSRQHYFEDPNDGIWDWMEVKQKVLASVGHNRGINNDGSPGFFRDDNDAKYVTNSLKSTTESTYRAVSEWSNSSFTGISLYTDTDEDYMPDWFENQHSHLDPNDPNDRDTITQDWDFGAYQVNNSAGYSNLEICAEFYAGGFETMIDGTNDMR
ncbi:pectate lyase [Flavobacteriaceae bacterium GF1]